MSKLNCAIYPRKSKVVDNSDSMEAQVDMCIHWLDNKFGAGNYTYTLYDGDYGISGHSTKNRKDFQRMMKDVNDGKIQIVVIQRFDRIARNTRDFCNLYHEMEMNGCELVSVSQQIDTTTPYGRNFMYMQASMAELEWALCSERRKDANRYAIQIGKCILPDKAIPLGYKAEKIDGIRRMVKDEKDSEAVLALFKNFRTYRNIGRTTRMLNTEYGKSIERTTVKNILKNTVYYGSYRGNDNYCEPYITKEEWEDAQRKLPVIREKPLKKWNSLFGGLIRCPHCNRMMTAQGKTKPNGNRYMYYKCSSQFDARCDFGRIRSELIIERQIIEMLSKQLEGYNVSVQGNTKIKDNSKKIEELEKELERLNTMFLKARISEEKYDAEYSRIQEQKALYEADTKPEKHSNNAHDILDANWLEIYGKLDIEHKASFWKQTLKQIVMDDNMDVIDVLFL